MTASEHRSRAEPFGYVCNGCGHCCHHFLVRLNAYEIQRLARNRGLSVQIFQARHTVQRGQGMRVLRQEGDAGRCTFRSAEGCAVYADRPLACRLYPLGRTLGADGAEHWRIPQPDPESRADWTGEGTIADFIAGGETTPYLAAADGG